MNKLSNSFSLLEIDVADDKHQTSIDSDGSSQNGNRGRNGKCEHVKESLECVEMSSEVFRMPLVWIDLEMTGLDLEVDRILEIACIITDGNLKKSVEGPHLIIHQTKECMDKMGDWCQTHHAASGLTKKVLQSTLSEQEAENQVIEFVNKNVGTSKFHLAGNSVYVDFQYLKKYMPNLASLFSHVLVDVSSIRALCMRWYPKDNRRAPVKEKKHRALDDIRESIAELKFFKDNIFKPSGSKK